MKRNVFAFALFIGLFVCLATGVFAQQNTTPEMVRINGGTFQRENNTITISAFYMGKYEVTQKEWTAVMGNNPSNFNGDNLPIVAVTWFDAVEYCNKLSQKEGLTPAYTISGRSPATEYPITAATVTRNRNANGYRLPTEAEWEYAARGGSGSPGNYTYAGSNNADEVAWHNGNSGEKMQNVGTKKPNGLGLYDMSGNVMEWCWDWYGPYPSGAQTDPTGASSGSDRVVRGGDYFSSAEAEYIRPTYRSASDPKYRYFGVGFRLARFAVSVFEQNASDFQYTQSGGQITITGYTGTVKAIVIPATINGMPVVAIGDYVFTAGRPGIIYGINYPDYGLTSVTIPGSVRTIGDSAFRGNKQLTSVIIPNGVTNIGVNAFDGCGLTSIIIPSSVTTIEGWAFSYNQLTTVTIPDSVTTVGEYAFYNNPLVSVSIGSRLTSRLDGFYVVNQVRTLIAINVASGNPAYSSVDGVVYNKTGTTLIYWPPAKTPVNIPSSVTTIAAQAFWYNQMSSVIIPNSVTVIEARKDDFYNAFTGNNLTSITIGANVTINGVGFYQGSSIGFKEAYYNGGRQAGTYTRPNTRSTTWIRQ